MTTDRIGALGRRGVLKGLAAGGTLAATAGFPGFIQAQTSKPIGSASSCTAPASAPPTAAGTSAPTRRRSR